VTLLESEFEHGPTQSLTHVKRVRPDDAQFEPWLAARHQFMQQMGWELSNEYDRYDDNPKTAHIVVNDNEGRLIVGMRLTPIDHYQEGLSWDMLAKAPHMRQEVIRSGDLDVALPLWDLTKLIQGETRVTSELSQQAIAELFAEGLKVSGAAQGQEAMWMFAITTPLFRLLSMEGLQLHALSQDRISPHDKSSSIFGYARTIDDVQASLSSPIMRTVVEAYE
jgi:N-acyl-L-homoserine lactone synthetase